MTPPGRDPRRPVILVADDYQDTREIVHEVLTDAGFEVLEADTGESALAEVAARRPDLILLDLSLPGIDGWEVAHRLRADPATATLPIVALTAHTSPAEHERARRAGCDDIVVKPCYPDDIVAAVTKFVPRP